MVSTEPSGSRIHATSIPGVPDETPSSSSSNGRSSGPRNATHTHYAASKAGVVAMTRTIARMFGKDDIVAVAIAPGFVRTELNCVLFDWRGIEPAVAETALDEFAEPTTSPIRSSSSPQASPATPRATLGIDGTSHLR
jgi:3-oxoacyl-[acyl-carrier protein] reductase